MNSQKQILLESLKQEGFSKNILDAFSKVKRENFVPKEMKKYAYENIPLSIGKGQTISQPYTIAMMFSLLELKKNQKILEIGSGCGYALALLSKIVGKKGEVFGIEIRSELVENSKKNLKDYKNVEVHDGNGRIGLKEKGPFLRILISASTDKVPGLLVEQLKEGGIIVAPLGSKYGQSLMAFRKIKGKLKIIKEIPGFVFVPLIGEH